MSSLTDYAGCFWDWRIKSYVSRLNLFKVLIVSSTLFLEKCVICSLDSSSSFSSFPSVITSVGCSENSETIYSTEKDRDWLIDWLIPRVLLGRLNWMEASMLGLFCQIPPVLNTLFLRSLRYAFFLWSFWTQYTSNFLSCINIENNQIQK